MGKRNLLLVTVVVIAAVALGVWALAVRTDAREVTYRTADVQRQDLRQTVSATGTVQPLTTVDIKSRAGGELKLLAVDIGTVVKPGDLIARIDPTDSQTTYNQAQADVTAARAKVSQARDTLTLQRQTTVTSIAEAEAGVRAAQARLEQAQKEAEAQPTLTKAAVKQAQAGLATARENLEQLKSAGDPQTRAEVRTGLQSAAANLKNAEQNLRRQEQLLAKGFVAQAAVDTARTERDVAKAQYDAASTRQETVGSNQKAAIAAAEARVHEASAALATAEAQRIQIDLKRQDVRNARAALAQAQANLAAAQANSRQIAIRAADIQSAQSQIARSEASLSNAQVQLNSTTIRAPRAGVVLQKYVEQGTIITSGQSFNSTGTSIVQLGDLSRVFVNAAVDEADIAQVKVGQPVKVALDAYPDVEFEGRVRRIDPLGTTDQNVTTIKTQVEILHPDARLKPGLNAECEFAVTQKPNALVVPPRAIKRQGQKQIVQVLVNGKPQSREVKTGLETNDAVEIVSGLKEGEKVVTQIIEPGGDGQGRSGDGRRGGPDRARGGPGNFSGFGR